MAVGWARDGAVQEQIDASVKDAVRQARSRLSQGESRTHCTACGETIPQKRRKAIPGVFFCIECQSAAEAQQSKTAGYNRRGSKDSQLK